MTKFHMNPDMPKPKRFQKRAFKVAKGRTRFLLDGAAGSGKSMLSLLLSARFSRPVFISTIASVQNKFSAIETQRWLSNPKVFVLKGTKPQKIPAGTEILFCNHNCLPAHRDTLINWVADNEATCVIDEVHQLANHQRNIFLVDERGDQIVKRDFKKRSAVAEDICAVSARVFGLSATPQRKDRPSLWGVLRTIFGKSMVPSYSEWRDRYCVMADGEHGGTVYESGQNCAELKAFLAANSIVITKEEVDAELPPLTLEKVRLPSSMQSLRGSIKEFKALMRAAAKKGPKSVQEVKIAQATFGKRNFALDEAIECLTSGKSVAFSVNRLREAEWLIENLKKRIKKEKLKAPVYGSHGNMTAGQIKKDIAAWLKPGRPPGVFVLTQQSAGTGVDLDTAHEVFILSIPTTPEQMIQLFGRFHRASTLISVRIQVVVASNSYDERAIELSMPRIQDVEKLFDSKLAGDIGNALGRQTKDEMQNVLAAFIARK